MEEQFKSTNVNFSLVEVSEISINGGYYFYLPSHEDAQCIMYCMY